jgi:hypothetical protein
MLLLRQTAFTERGFIEARQRLLPVLLCLCVTIQCLPYDTLMKAWSADPSSDIVAAGVQLLRQRTRLFVGMLRAGAVKAEVRRSTNPYKPL